MVKQNQSAQEFWLSHLGGAQGYNGWIYSNFEPHLGKEILEVGCGTGTFTQLMAQKAHRLVAVEMESSFIEIAKERTRAFPQVEFICADVTHSPLPIGFDTVIMLDVLEHLRDDMAVLATLRETLKPGGRLIIKVPALAWLYNPIDASIGHFRRYNRSPLHQVISQAGFKDIEIWPFNLVGILGWWLNGNLLRRTTPPSQQINGFNRIAPILQRMERWLPLPVGLSYFAVGKK